MKKFFHLSLGLLVSMLAMSGSTLAAEKSTDAPLTPVVQNAPAAEKAMPEAINTSNMVNINTASAAEIQDKLVGIGAKKAQAIVEYRTKNGAFSSSEQLTDVSGIGKATLDKNRDRILLQ